MEKEQPSNVIDMTERLEDTHLAREHGLVPVKAYIHDAERAEKRTANAERVARHREKKKAEGLQPVDLPAEIAARIREVGLQEFLDQIRGAGPRQVRVEVQVEKPVEVVREVLKVERVEVPVLTPAKLTAEQNRLISLGQKVERLPTWRRWLAGL